ncbi:MAG: deaminase [Veillonella sp.]|nr:deaminase [Veillonella sp.]
MAKRNDYISWDEYFMGVAILAAQRSKDPNTQVGACIVSNDNKILSIGSLEGSKIYVTLFPCNECAKAIIQSGIKAVIYRDDLYKDTKEVKASKRMLKTAGVEIIEYKPTGRTLNITL